MKLWTCAIWVSIAAICAGSPATIAESVAPATSNPEMARIFDADQSDRNARDPDPRAILAADAQRRERTRALLNAGKLSTAEDYRDAAFIFQHGTQASDYLFAHTLAMVAAEKGDQTSLWIAAATLDRYLVAIKQKQIFGTQYNRTASGLWTQEPYDRQMVGDPMRTQLGLKTRPEQELKLKSLNGAPNR